MCFQTSVDRISPIEEEKEEKDSSIKVDQRESEPEEEVIKKTDILDDKGGKGKGITHFIAL